MPRAGHRRDFGSVRKRANGRWQAFYADPDGRTEMSRTGTAQRVRYVAPHTFTTKLDAEAWLADEYRLISSGRWKPPAARQAEKLAAGLTFGEYSDTWLATRQTRGRALAERTREQYRWLLDTHLLGTFGPLELRTIEPDHVDRWYETTAVDHPTARAQAYSLLRTILGTAVDRRLISSANPARIRGAGNVQRARDIRVASLDDLATIAEAMPERHQLLVLLAAWCALRFGELAELRRTDIDTKAGTIKVRRGVVRTKAGHLVKTPKSDAGTRDVAIPPHLLPALREHLLQHAAPGKNGLLFPGARGGHLQPATFYGKASTFDEDGEPIRNGYGWYAARQAAGREDLRFHDLRHTGATLAAATGATLADLMARLGHSTQGAALRYQHAAAERDVEIARKLSAMVANADA